MTPLSAITGLPPDAAELLNFAGIRSVTELSRQEPSALHSRLEVLAWQRGRATQAPTQEQLLHWVSVARVLVPPASPEVEAMSMDDIPEAVTVKAPSPSPAAVGNPAWIPPALRAAREAEGTALGTSSPQTEPTRQQQQPAQADNSWRKVDPSQFATIEAYNEGRIGVQPLSRESLKAAPEASAPREEDGHEASATRRIQRIRSTGDSLSRWVRRGVVHPRPAHTWLGALVSVVWRIALVTGIAGFIWLVTSSDNPSAHKEEVIAAAVVLLVLGCMQLHFAGRSRCRICSCNLFYSKNCHKNRKAHLIPGLGYVASASLHLLIFGWFRCMYCGTAIRLHPSKREE